MRKLLVLAVSILLLISFMPFEMMAYADDYNDFIEIRTVDDLYNVRFDMGSNYKMMCDIDMSEAVGEGGEYNYQGAGWEPFGGTTSTPFTGVFDGNGHVIKGVVINGSYNGWSALFWQNDGTIQNLRVEGSITKGGYSVDSGGEAMIVGLNNGTISKCSSKADINTYSKEATGIIAAKNKGVISQCLSEGIIYSRGYSPSTSNGVSKRIGGICGISEEQSIVTECVNTASMSAGYCDGCICGITYATDDVTITNCYNTGDVKGYYYNGHGNDNRFVWPYGISEEEVENCYNAGVIDYYGYSPLGTAVNGTNCYYLDGTGSSSTATALNEVQMTKQASFIGFDFNNIWTISSATDYKYPQLRNNMVDTYKHVDIIEWKTLPTKIDFYTDEDVDPTGGVFTAYYIDDTHEDVAVTKDMLSGYDMTQTGVQMVTVTFREGTLTYDILTSTRPEVRSMTLETMPDKTEFVRGTYFDFTGATARVEYVNGDYEIIPITAEETTGGDITHSGTYTIVFEKYGKSVSFEVKVVPVKAVGIKIASPPDKTVYIEGQSLDLTGLVVKLVYNNGKSETITDYTVGDYENTIGTKEITVSYEGFSASFTVEFMEKNLTAIMVTTQPTRVRYIVGEEFDPTGMVVKAVYDNGLSEEITDYTVSPLTNTIGWQTLTVSYEGKTTTLKVYVEEKELVSIVVSVLPDKTEYIEGQAFDPTGMVVLANYNNILMEEVTDYTVSANTNKVGVQTVTVLFEGKTATFTINVVEKTLVKISVTPPTKTEYILGEEFDSTGMVVKAFYDNGKIEEVTDYTVTGFGDTEETNIVTVEYKGKTSAFAVIIHTPEANWTIITTPTCTEQGSKELHCANCGKLLKTEAIPANGHSWDAGVVTTEATCTHAGEMLYTCTVCNATKTEVLSQLAHAIREVVAVEPTCTLPGNSAYYVCDSCGQFFLDEAATTTIEENSWVLPAKGHTWGDWVVVEAPDCVNGGSQQRTCDVCGTTETQNLDPNGHTWAEEVTVDQAPDCTTDGSQSRHCLYCDQKTDVTTLPALGHDWDTEHIAWNWAEGFSSAEATFTCKRDHSHTETLTAAVTNETVSGIITYTASVVLEGATYTDTKTVDAHAIIRVFGKSRYLTAIAAADHLKEKKGITTFDNIVVASGDGFPDALSASYLAYKKDGPILLYGKSAVGTMTDYINANLSPGGIVYIVGGKGAVPIEVEEMINGTVKRLSGSNRYATNMAVLNEAGVEGEDLLIASGSGFADALSASAAKRPIFLVGTSLTADQKKYLDDNSNAMSGKIYLIGGKGAVSLDIEDAVKSYGSVTRLSGKSRYLTSIAVAEEFFPDKVDNVVIANGNNFPDGLSGGPVAVAYDAPLVLVIDSITDHAVQYFSDKDSFRLIIMGGKGAISDEAAEKIFSGTE